MDHLMNRKFSHISGFFYNRIPLVTRPKIDKGNALQVKWPEGMNYIMGNPPYTGSCVKNQRQIDEMNDLGVSKIGLADYVTAWIVIASRYMMENKSTRTAFVTTNSVNQGEQVSIVWKPLFESGICINFAVPSFKWSNESKNNAAVVVSIIGFSMHNTEPHVNAYLKKAPDLWVTSVNSPICNVPRMSAGNALRDWGNYIFTEESKELFLETEPQSAKYIHPLAGGEDFIVGEFRYVLHLENCPETELASMPECLKRVEIVRENRTKSRRVGTQRVSKIPKEFERTHIAQTRYLAIPSTSSQRRLYIPMAFLEPETYCTHKLQMIDGATEYHFGILTSRIHMAWTRNVCGRFKKDYEYSSGIVYNNFIWPVSGYEDDITGAANHVLDTRKPYLENGKNLAWLYNPETMPDDLKTAHETLDAVVDAAYGLVNPTDDERFALLCKLYNEAIKQ
jgi:hypothetical protein